MRDGIGPMSFENTEELEGGTEEGAVWGLGKVGALGSGWAGEGGSMRKGGVWRGRGKELIED